MQIGVTGGKGGTGKSTIATALAVALAKDARVLLVDADADCPNDHLLLGIQRSLIMQVEQRLPVWDGEKCTHCGACSAVCKTNALVAVRDRPPLFMPAQCHGCGACLAVCPGGVISWSTKVVGYIHEGSNHGIDLLSGELKVNEPAAERTVVAMKQMVKQQEDHYDYIIIDTAAGTHCDVVAALEGADYVLAVTESTPLGAHDLDLILQLIARLHIVSDIIINRHEPQDTGLITELAAKYNSRIIAKVPYSLAIARHYARGEPVQCKEIDLLAHHIYQQKAVGK